VDSDLNNSLPISEKTPPQWPASVVMQTAPTLAADASTLASGPWGRLLRIASAPDVLAMADQAVVSGTSFVTTFIIARWATPSQLGFYSIGLSVLLASLCVQDALVSRPYMILCHRSFRTPAEHAGSSLMHSGLLSALVTVALAVAALALSARGAGPELVLMIWVLAGIAPFALFREFVRRLAFAHLQVALALMLDLAVAVIQLVGVGWLGWTGRLSSATACLALGAACALTAIMSLYLGRANYEVRGDQLRATMKESWAIGKWLVSSQITVSVQVSVAQWLLAWIMDTTATGIYAACMAVASFANPLILGLGGTMMPKAVLALKEGGGASLRRQSIRYSLLLGAATGLFCVVVLIAGEDMMRLFCHRKEYEGQGHTISVLALAMLALAVGSPASNALASMERPRAIFFANLFGAVLNVALVWSLAVKWGVVGAAFGFLSGSVAGALGKWVAFLALVPRYAPETDPLTTDFPPCTCDPGTPAIHPKRQRDRPAG
jgi:O-antigen/teichoic acid export membrane protein